MTVQLTLELLDGSTGKTVRQQTVLSMADTNEQLSNLLKSIENSNSAKNVTRKSADSFTSVIDSLESLSLSSSKSYQIQITDDESDSSNFFEKILDETRANFTLTSSAIKILEQRMDIASLQLTQEKSKTDKICMQMDKNTQNFKSILRDWEWLENRICFYQHSPSIVKPKPWRRIELKKPKKPKRCIMKRPSKVYPKST